jgi:hypothetical protein
MDPSGERPTLAGLIRSHLTTDPAGLSVVEESWAAYEHVNVQAGIDAWLEDDRLARARRPTSAGTGRRRSGERHQIDGRADQIADHHDEGRDRDRPRPCRQSQHQQHRDRRSPSRSSLAAARGARIRDITGDLADPTAAGVRDPGVMTESTDVLIVGAGPTGLALALGLTERGVDHVIVDGLPAGATTSRAAVVHARTLEVLAPLGVAEPLIHEGITTTRFTIRDRDRVLMTVGFSDLPTPYPFTLMVSQATTEAVLIRRLADRGLGVRRPDTLAGLAPGPDDVTATFAAGDSLTARWVVGADGMHSAVRQSAGIAFCGEAYPESFLLADVRLGSGAPSQEVILYFSPSGLMVLAPLPGGVHRVVATLDPAPEQPDAGDVQSLLDPYLGSSGGRVGPRQVRRGTPAGGPPRRADDRPAHPGGHGDAVPPGAAQHCGGGGRATAGHPAAARLAAVRPGLPLREAPAEGHR